MKCLASIFSIIFLLGCNERENNAELDRSLTSIEEYLGIDEKQKEPIERVLLIEETLDKIRYGSMVIGQGRSDTISGDTYRVLMHTKAYFPEVRETVKIFPSNGIVVDSIHFDKFGILHEVFLSNIPKGSNEFTGYIVNELTNDTILVGKSFYRK